MTEQATGIVPSEASGLDLPTQNTISIARVGEVERIEQSVLLPAIYQYQIARYGQAPKVMLTSDAYDFLNRAMGVQLYQPDWVNDETGKRVRNPIHRADYIYLRLIGIWTNDLGQTVSYREDVEVDFKLVYMDARINSKSARVEMDPDGMPKFSESGMPIVKLDPADELKALKALSQLRTFGLRYAQTVAKTRILKTASGIRTLPIAQPRSFAIRVVGYRDKLTPEERIKRAEQDLEGVFGRSKRLDENAGLTRDELAEVEDIIEAGDQTDDLDRDLIEAAQDIVNEPVDDDPDATPPMRRVGPEDFDPAEDGSLGLGEAPPSKDG